jgi:release factor glutamine methyltransferase
MEPTGEIVIHNALGVCSAEADTRLMARLSAEYAPAGGRVLDLGTGTGYIAIYLAQRGFVVEAVDISERALQIAGENAARNGVQVRLYRSDLFSDVRGAFDLIAFNPPMNPDETELTRLITSFLRRRRFIANLLMGMADRFLTRSRMGFLLQFIEQARRRLTAGGFIVLELRRPEADELPQHIPDIELLRREDIPGMRSEQIVVLRLRGETPA